MLMPVFERRGYRRKKGFKSFWMTCDENFEIIKRIDKKKLIKKKKKLKKEAVAKARKIKAVQKRKQKKNTVKK